MPLLRFDKVSLAYGHHPLLSRVDLDIEAGERVCLVGRNGTGKSTLFRVITGAATPDDGEVWRPDTLRVAHLEQEVPPDSRLSIFETVAEGLGETGHLLTGYHNAAMHSDGGAEALRELAALQARIEARGGWNQAHKVDTVLSRLNLPPDKPLAACSGGLRRQVMLARALVSDPDLLLLDEPTNHLDIAAILWLEEYLLDFSGALVFITHDRAFLRHLATRIIELDRGVLVSFPGDYDHYLRRKEEMLDAEARAAEKFDKKLAAEEAWIRRGIQARRTRNEGRVRALQAMRRERARRLDSQGSASFGLDAGESSGKLVVDLRDVSFGYGDHQVVRGLSTRILRGDRVGIVGPNGSGKSTLLKLILGELAPTSGQVVMGTRLATAYFDQQRAQLDPDKTVRQNVSEGSDYVDVRGRSRHVIGYLKEFLFPAERIDSPVKALSGGERNRLLLAKLFTRPANLMVLDEPTNDLDVDTLELLEDLLTEYEGTLLLVSHDRAFLDNVVTSTLVFEGNGRVGEYVGGYEDWLRQRAVRQAGAAAPRTPAVAARKGGDAQAPPRRKLGYKEQRELDALPARIEALEREQDALQVAMHEPAFFQQPGEAIAAHQQRLEAIARELAQAYQRWETLEG